VLFGSSRRHGGRDVTALGLFCLSYILWRPVSNGVVLYPVLALLAASALARCVTGQRRVFRSFAVTGYLLIVAGLITALVGSVNATPGFAQQSTVWFGSTFIWGLWAVSMTRDKVRLTLRVVTIATALLSGLIILYIGANQGILPSIVPDSLLNAQGAGYDLTGDGSAIRLYGLSTLAAAGPLVSSALVAGKDKFLPSRALLAVATILAVLAAIFAGRRAIAAVTIASPLVTYALLRLLRPRAHVARPTTRLLKWILGAPLILVLSVVAFHFSLLDRPLAALGDGLHLYFNIGNSSGGAKAASDVVREQQTGELVTAWGGHPWFGSGLGAVLPDGFVRSADRPWMFELQYHQLLFSSGLVGAGLLSAAFVSAWHGVRRAAAASPEHVPTIVATSVAAISMLVANASNPYLQAVGNGWAIALILGVANALLVPKVEAVVPVGSGTMSSVGLFHR